MNIQNLYTIPSPATRDPSNHPWGMDGLYTLSAVRSLLQTPVCRFWSLKDCLFINVCMLLPRGNDLIWREGHYLTASLLLNFRRAMVNPASPTCPNTP